MTPDYIRAHRHAIYHREEILASERCGCFYCGAIFLPSEVVDWTDAEELFDKGTTAICPKCGIDSVISSESGYPITPEFLKRMRIQWFETIHPLPEA
jgi:hypothetical protein